MFPYMSCATREEAEEALGDLYATGEVSECEFAGIYRRGDRYVIWLHG